MNFTPGPWVASRSDTGTFQVATVEMLGIYSEHPEGGSAACGAPHNDAALIAAAPELFDALRGLIKHIGVSAVLQDLPEFNAARAAINKALGQA
jgi:hypothetical protein